jgi:catalase
MQRDGHMQMQVPKGRVNYEPSSLQGRHARALRRRGAFATLPRPTMAVKGRVRAESFADHYSQARMFYRSQSPLEQAHMASATVFELSKVETPHVREAVVGHLQHVDPSWPSAWPTAWACRPCRLRRPLPSPCKTCRCRPRCASSTA